MKKNSPVVKTLRTIPRGQIKAVLRGGTFHRVSVLLEEGQDYIEHCGLDYKVTNQKDSKGRLICIWSREGVHTPNYERRFPGLLPG
jgi:hypothetical protein